MQSIKWINKIDDNNKKNAAINIRRNLSMFFLRETNKTKDLRNSN